jgi:hypothetical protein
MQEYLKLYYKIDNEAMANVIGDFYETDCILLFEAIRNIIVLPMYQLCCNFDLMMNQLSHKFT